MNKTILEMPLVPLKGMAVLPVAIVSVNLQDMPFVQLNEALFQKEKDVFFVTTKSIQEEEISEESVYTVGVIGTIKQVVRLRDGSNHILAQGLKRARLMQIKMEGGFLQAVVEVLEETPADPADIPIKAVMRSVLDAFETLAKINPNFPPDMFMAMLVAASPGELADTVISALRTEYTQKQRLLEMLDQKERLFSLHKLLVEELEMANIQKELTEKVKQNIDQKQKEYYLREQLRIIRQELGDTVQSAAEGYKKALEEKTYPQVVRQKVEQEIARLESMPGISQENAMMMNYIEWVLALPWQPADDTAVSIKEAEGILDESHYGLGQVKERILEYLAVSQAVKSNNGPVLCLIGPPGTGKSTIAQSIAQAMGRQFVRISFGGVRDEADIRGHRRTYIASMPGRILAAMRQAGVSNPVILMDEVDKISKDFRQDPSAALLEVFDKDQNKNFRDHYLELEYDLSQVVFICTANQADQINPTLRDRLELLNLDSYTLQEKLAIGKEHLLPKQMKAYGLTRSKLKINPNVWEALVTAYTKEAGVRQLNQVVEAICRKTVKLFLSEDKKSFTLTAKNMESFIGSKKYRFDKVQKKSEVGVVRGLAYTSVGGDTLQVEVNVMPGSGKLQLTGNMGKIMQESARAAISYVRSRTAAFHIQKDFYKKLDIHIHVPEGAVPKDGPSAGITLAASLVSALTDRPVSGEIAMTGEITIRGNVLPVGGIKEKVLAAKMAGVKKVILPDKNKHDVDRIATDVLEGMVFSYVAHMDQVLEEAILKERK